MDFREQSGNWEWPRCSSTIVSALGVVFFARCAESTRNQVRSFSKLYFSRFFRFFPQKESERKDVDAKTVRTGTVGERREKGKHFPVQSRGDNIDQIIRTTKVPVNPQSKGKRDFSGVWETRPIFSIHSLFIIPCASCYGDDAQGTATTRPPDPWS